MELLKERIRREGKVLPGNIIKVDGFLNHRVDTALMSQLADEFAKYFDVNNITMVLTAEASGIPLATVCAQKYGVPMVFAKKAKSDNIEGGLYQSEIFSYTYKKKVTLIVAQEWLGPNDRVLIIEGGMISQYARPESIIHTPKNDFVRKFILNQLEIKRNNIYALFGDQLTVPAAQAV